jgi:transcriptional regulator with XRE-family HTH domain
MGKNLLKALLTDKMKNESLSLREAAKQIGVSHTTVSRILDGSSPDIDTLVAISEWLGVSPSHIIGAYQEGHEGLSEEVSVLLEYSPELAEYIGGLAELVEKGELDPRVMEDVWMYAKFKLEHL